MLHRRIIRENQENTVGIRRAIPSIQNAALTMEHTMRDLHEIALEIIAHRVAFGLTQEVWGWGTGLTRYDVEYLRSDGLTQEQIDDVNDLVEDHSPEMVPEQ